MVLSPLPFVSSLEDDVQARVSALLGDGPTSDIDARIDLMQKPKHRASPSESL